jgi:putative ATP-dependent endonuclease of the OLD family
MTNDRDLRLIQGAALDRLLADKTLRSRLGKLFRRSDVEQELNDDAKVKLNELDEAFRENALPVELGLGLTGGERFSLSALIGLTAAPRMVLIYLSPLGVQERSDWQLLRSQRHITVNFQLRSLMKSSVAWNRTTSES